MSSRSLSWHPLRFEIRVRQPFDRFNHRCNGSLHVLEIYVGEIVAWFVVVGMQAITGNGVRNNALASEGIIVRTFEEALSGMGIGNQSRAMPGKLRAKIAAVKACEPELVTLDRRVRPANHLKLQIGNNIF